MLFTRVRTAADPTLLSFGPFKNYSAKEITDYIAAFAVLILLFPLIISTIILIFLVDGAPITIRHKRLGRGGEPFWCLKFRTMRVGADALLQKHLESDAAARQEWDATRKLRSDPRVTPLGLALRKSSLDELPQLLNVLRGEMSLVGPRPIVEEEACRYGSVIQKYYRVRPGLTGLWQVSGRSDASYESRVELDARYVDTQSFWGDVIILLKTIPAVLGRKGSY